MELNTSSRYLQLTDYSLLEYEYNSDIISTSEVDFIRVLNAYTGTMSYINYNQGDYSKPKMLTGNSLDFSVQQINSNLWIHFDVDRPLSYYEGYDALKFQPIYLGRTQEINVLYDTIRVHLVSGYNFDDLAGFIIRASYADMDTYAQCFVANIAYLKEDTHITFNSHPMLLGDRVYDRYVEVKIPSLRSILDTNQQTSSIFKPVINYGSGLKYENYFSMPNLDKSRINMVFYEVKDYVRQANGQIEIRTAVPLGNDTEGVVRRELLYYDTFSNLSAVIQESVLGDYFELFPIYNGELIEDFIYEQGRIGHQYMGIHDIELYEQTSDGGQYGEIMTHKQTFFQESGFDNVTKYRPIVENSNAITFTIEYTFRLLDRSDNSQVIRRATYTYPNAQKYGKWMQKINIPLGYQPMRVVNKIIRSDSNSVSSGVYNLSRSDNSNLMNNSSTLIMPLQYRDISVNSYTLYVDSATSSTPKVLYEANGNEIKLNEFNFKSFTSSDVIYGQGDAIVYLTNFDNFIKFRLFKYTDKTSGIPEVYSDLRSNSSLNFYIVFYNRNGDEIRINELTSLDNVTLDTNESGILLFKINSQASQLILNSDNPNFYITMENKKKDKILGTNAWNTQKDFEITLYSGKWSHMRNYSKLTDVDYMIKEKMLTDLVSDIELKEDKIDKIERDYSVLMNDLERTVLTADQKAIIESFDKRLAELIEEAKKPL